MHRRTGPNSCAACTPSAERPWSFQVRHMFTFEWDDQKAASNLQKHRVSFDEAVSVFAGGLALTFAGAGSFNLE